MRIKLWQVDGLKKVRQLSFLTEGAGRTLAQAALKFILAEPSIASVLPNIYNEQALSEFVAASDCPDVTLEEYAHVQQLYADNFGLPACAAPSATTGGAAGRASAAQPATP